MKDCLKTVDSWHSTHWVCAADFSTVTGHPGATHGKSSPTPKYFLLWNTNTELTQ